MGRWTVLGAAVGAVVLVVVVVLALSDRTDWSVEDVPSGWNGIPMSCHTTRLGEDEHALELFRCHAVDGEGLPTGVYGSPRARWRSDLTHRRALADRMVITPDGILHGWAVY